MGMVRLRGFEGWDTRTIAAPPPAQALWVTHRHPEPERRPDRLLIVRRTRTRSRRPAVVPLAALWAAILIALGLVVPVLAVEGPTKLFDPSVSPSSGLATTTIRFAVSYRNHEGSPADHVFVVIDGAAHAMTADGTSNWKQGVRHTWSARLPVGVHQVRFDALSRDRFSDTIDGGTVRITAPPSSTPKPTPAPTHAPAATPTPAPAGSGSGGTSGPSSSGGTGDTSGSGGSSGAGSTGALDPGAGAAGGIGSDTTPGAGSTGSGDGAVSGVDGWPAGLPNPDGNATGAALGTGPETAGAGGSTGASGANPGTDGAIDPGNGSGVGATHDGAFTGGGWSGPGWGGLASALQVLGVQQPAITVLPMLVGTTAAATMAFAFAIFGKKRRDEQPPAPDEVLHANAARGVGNVPRGEAASGVVRSPATIPVDTEAGMPRWRRPSLLEARKADPTRSAGSAQKLSFEGGAVGAVAGRERHVIRYRVVRLLDAPDELRSAEIGQLDQGDEVQLVERSGSYWLVLCPDGRQGWLHKMTLGETVSDAAGSQWTPEVDDDVLSAFLQARARA